MIPTHPGDSEPAVSDRHLTDFDRLADPDDCDDLAAALIGKSPFTADNQPQDADPTVFGRPGDGADLDGNSR